MVDFLLWVAIIIVFTVLCIYGLRILKFIFKRLWFAFRLFIMSVFCKGFEYCYKTPWSVFAGRKNKYSDVLVYYGGTVYIIKLCGFFHKATDVIVHKENVWQIDTYLATGRLLTGTKSTNSEVVHFNLSR